MAKILQFPGAQATVPKPKVTAIKVDRNYALQVLEAQLDQLHEMARLVEDREEALTIAYAMVSTAEAIKALEDAQSFTDPDRVS